MNTDTHTPKISVHIHILAHFCPHFKIYLHLNKEEKNQNCVIQIEYYLNNSEFKQNGEEDPPFLLQKVIIIAAAAAARTQENTSSGGFSAQFIFQQFPLCLDPYMPTVFRFSFKKTMVKIVKFYK